MNNINFDVGTNLTSLGFFYLILKFLLNPIIGLILLVVAAVIIYQAWTRWGSTNFEGFDLDNRATQVALIIGIFLIVVFITVISAVI